MTGPIRCIFRYKFSALAPARLKQLFGRLLGIALVIFVALENTEAEPAPIDAMALDQAVTIEIHRFHEIHLLALAGIARVFPNQSLAIGEIAGPIILAHWRLPDRENVEERSNLLVTAQIAAIDSQKVRHEGALEPSVF